MSWSTPGGSDSAPREPLRLRVGVSELGWSRRRGPSRYAVLAWDRRNETRLFARRVSRSSG